MAGFKPRGEALPYDRDEITPTIAPAMQALLTLDVDSSTLVFIHEAIDKAARQGLSLAITLRRKPIKVRELPPGAVSQRRPDTMAV